MNSKNHYPIKQTFIEIKSLYKDKSLYIYKDIRGLSDKAIDDFQKLYIKKFGKPLARKQAETEFTMLLRIILLINKTKV